MSWHDRRHIQNFTEGNATQPHWGYADRIVPCKNDPGSCAYLDAVYDAHDLGMLYVGIFWASIGGILLLWAFLKHLGRPSMQPPPRGTGHGGGGLGKLRRTTGAVTRRYLLPEANHLVFGRTTRFQVFILAILSGYLLVLTFVGIVYNTWITPVKNMPGVYNTRTSLGPWSDRVGVIAYALTPLSVMLSSRESLLSMLTGVPYQSFNFLHRWLGYIIFAQGALHTIGWCVVEIRLYQPQPSVGIEWIAQTYMIWGVVAMFLLTLLFVLSTPWGIRLTGYEFFRKAHYVLAMVYIGACWAHWENLQCFLLPSLLLWGLDRGARFVRTALLHHHPSSYTNPGFSPVQAIITRFPDAEHGDVLRLDFENEQDCWSIGQHFYVCFTECSIWQSHPFTPLNAPMVEGGAVKHSYILRAKSGETKKLAGLAIAKQANVGDMGPDANSSPGPTTPVILTGPYGENTMDRITTGSNIVCVAGGTGITYVLPILLQLSRQRPVPDRKVELIWAMRHSSNVAWVREEMISLRKAQKASTLTIRLFATRDAEGSEDKMVKNGKNIADVGSSCSEDACPCNDAVSVRRIGEEGTGGSRHPDLCRLVGDFVESTISGRTVVFASGPGGMITDLRSIVAARNSASRVWNGQEKFDVDLVCDDRLEW
ncbi:Ferric-chelate reductase [Tolypocladium paradoxum]|uniref:Ferric-chelate reductase n=1 Tax=Tolypocladium paradoxum TaxID=94208 RepID=A0A2S4KTK6_9HYPO|nr:Ferric-chelate reductase [Tolypocladium paradoxum]